MPGPRKSTDQLPESGVALYFESGWAATHATRDVVGRETPLLSAARPGSASAAHRAVALPLRGGKQQPWDPPDCPFEGASVSATRARGRVPQLL
jgi:hypothetical protein